HGAGHRLPDPPGGVGGELVALRIAELLDGADEAEVPLLNEVDEEHPAPGVPLGEGHHEPQVRLEQVVLRAAPITDDPAQLAAEFRSEVVALFGEFLLSEEA